MGLKGTIRTLNTTLNKIERESKKRERELEKRKKQYFKMKELEQASFEVEKYENYLERIQTLHKDYCKEVNWLEIKNLSLPLEPKVDNSESEKLEKKYKNFKANFLQRLFKLEEKSKIKLKNKIKNIKKNEEETYKLKLSAYNDSFVSISQEKDFAKSIIDLERSSLLKIINEFISSDELNELGSNINIIDDDKIIIEIDVHSINIVPKESKTLLKSGKLSVKKIPKGKFNEIYQDYVCSSILRIAKELFNLIPIEELFITAKDEILNTKTGYKELKPILSVKIVRSTFFELNLEHIDPSDSMDNFICNMDFKKTVGFNCINTIY